MRRMVLTACSMFLCVQTPACVLCLMAAFSAGRPKASKPMGCSTSKPRMRAWRAMASPMV